MGNKWGFHSGVGHMKDCQVSGDLYVQDDIVFSDVSAGVLGVTGGIDMTGTTSAIGISLTGGSFTTGAIMCGTGTSARQTMAEAEDFVLGIYTTCADTDGANTAKPLYVNAQYTGAGQVARAAEFVLYPTAKLGGWANALKAYTDFSGDNDGGTTGLASSACLEMKLPNGATNGAFYPLEIEWVGQASTAFGKPGTGSQSGFMYLAASGTVTDFDDDGVFFSVTGLTAGATHMLSTNSQSLKVDIGNGTTRYIVLSTTEDVISLTGTDVFTFTTSGGKLSAAAASTTLYGGGTTGDALVLQGSSVDAGQKLTITGASGSEFTGNLSIASTGTFTTGTGDVTIKGDMSIDAGKDFDMSGGDGTFATGTGAVSLNGDTTLEASKKFYVRDTGLYIYSSTNGQLDIVADTTVAISGATTFNNTIDIGSQGSGIAVATGNEFVMEVHAKPTTVLTAGDTGLSAGIRCRYEVGAAQTNQISVVAIDSRLRPKYAMADGAHAGINAGIESDAVAFTGTASTQRSAGHFYIEMATGTTISSGWLTGITIDSSVHGDVDVSSCTFAGLRIKTSAGKEVWTHGEYIEMAGVVTGITTAGTSTSATGRAAKFAGTISAAAHGDGYGLVEAELTLTGTQADHTAALTAWVNTNAGDQGNSGLQICAQNNGIWEGGSGSITGATCIFGMKMQYLATSTDAGGVYPFAMNIDNPSNSPTALFKIGTAAGEMSQSGDSSANSTKKTGVIPFYDANGVIGYINIYSANAD